MDIVISHCNNIDVANVHLEPSRLNIKYGPNGIGKSTIARAIAFNAENSSSKLEQLRQFKARTAPNKENAPSVRGADSLKVVSIFGEDYVTQFAFQRDEILKNSFEIFVKTPEFDGKMKDIEALILAIRQTFSRNERIDKVIADLQELSECFGKSQSGISKAGRISKGLGAGNKIVHVPPQLEGYASFIRSAETVSWIKWQSDGKRFLGLSNSCPFCTASTEEREDTIQAVSEYYDAKSIEHLLVVQGVFSRLGDYFSDDTKSKLDRVLKSDIGLKKEEANFLVGIKSQTDTLREKLIDARAVSFFSLRDAGEVREAIANLKIDLSLLPCLVSDATTGIVNEVNDCLDSVITIAGQLEGEVNKQKRGIERTIKRYKTEINGFLKYAGYRYEVAIEPEGSAYKMKLKHADSGDYLEAGTAHLSYGEKNAFAIVLFMYECLTKKPDLVVLDDPVSSFDDNKKFAILEMLFRGSESLQGKTVLMLTHDIEPIIDLIKTMGHTFRPPPVAVFLTSSSGRISEIPIGKADIQSFTQICNDNISQTPEPTIQIIYLRRHFEADDDKSNAYHLLSNLLHKRVTPTTTDNGSQRPMTIEEIANATDQIRVRIPHFDYSTILAKLTDTPSMKTLYSSVTNRITKLHLFRVISADTNMQSVDDVIKKYINEAFHVQNEFIMQLNPQKYDSVPEYIIDECDRLLGLRA